MRQIGFEVLPPETAFEEPADITEILEDWVLYQEAVFDKEFSDDLKSYTHQIYTQPDFYKTPYGRKLLSNLYTMIKTMFLPSPGQDYQASLFRGFLGAGDRRVHIV